MFTVKTSPSITGYVSFCFFIGSIEYNLLSCFTIILSQSNLTNYNFSYMAPYLDTENKI